MTPISADTSTVVPVRARAKTTPISASGRVKMMMNGIRSDSNCPAITMKTRMLEAMSAKKRLWNDSWKSSALPPISKVKPSGQSIASSTRRTESMAPERSRPRSLPLESSQRDRSVRSSWLLRS